jgi:hypothetical protein
MSVIREIAIERKRQISNEGWTAQHDDEHTKGELALVAASYASHAATFRDAHTLGMNYSTKASPPNWPWSRDWWKPTDRRRDLVKAGALIIAEIERIDRAERQHLAGVALILQSRFGESYLDE